MKKNKIAWVTDSTATLSDEFIRDHDIYIIPLYINFGEKSYKENTEITAEDFYDMLSKADELPKTSQPSIGEFVELYEKLRDEYEKIIAIHASSALTGTYQSSCAASEMVGVHVDVIDSKIGSYALGKIIERGVQKEKAGESYEEIVSYLRALPDRAQLYMVPGSLEQLRKGGRMSSAQVLIGNLIRLKLIIKFEDGKVVLADKVRTYGKVKQRLFEIFDEVSHKIKEASVIHGNDLELAESWMKELQGIYPSIRFTTTIFSPVPGTHTGQGTIGLSWIND
ncbi:DegV family protein [Bacillus sp. HMF5848]|uniref:DegV family protein n=1 Tax=Bacillus sp. HMF5848 TaxID=2495421 RepID=UPI000F7AF004|nr:DegV family protein [Bacillus sp. HMF5848]RSK26204.1 DegV family protein [Bacillus sp. HMF5848]